MKREHNMSFHNDRTVVPFILKDKKAILALYEVARNTINSYTNKELAMALHKWGKFKSTTINKKRLNWYGKMGLIKFTDVLPDDGLNTVYRLRIQIDALYRLVGLLESIDYYGMDTTTKAIMHILAYYDRHPEMRSDWIDSSVIIRIFSNRSSTIFAATPSGESFSRAVSDISSPLDRTYSLENHKVLLYRPNHKAKFYVDTWRKIRDWVAIHSTDKTALIHSTKGVVIYNGQWE